MPKVTCPWITCKYNSSNRMGQAGYCNKESISLFYFTKVSDTDELIEGLECVDYLYNGTKKIIEVGE